MSSSGSQQVRQTREEEINVKKDRLKAQLEGWSEKTIDSVVRTMQLGDQQLDSDNECDKYADEACNNNEDSTQSVYTCGEHTEEGHANNEETAQSAYGCGEYTKEIYENYEDSAQSASGCGEYVEELLSEDEEFLRINKMVRRIFTKNSELVKKILIYNQREKMRYLTYRMIRADVSTNTTMLQEMSRMHDYFVKYYS